MRQSNNFFIPLRLCLALTAMLLAMVLPSAASMMTHSLESPLGSEPVLIDPITTGGSVSQDAAEKWKAANKNYMKCGLCGQIQAFPGDLPE